MSDFLDMTDADSFDTAAPDPEAVARVYLKIRKHARSSEPTWEEATPQERALLLIVFAALLERLRREGAVP